MSPPWWRSGCAVRSPASRSPSTRARRASRSRSRSGCRARAQGRGHRRRAEARRHRALPRQERRPQPRGGGGGLGRSRIPRFPVPFSNIQKTCFRILAALIARARTVESVERSCCYREPSYPAHAGYPVRRGFSIPSQPSLEYWVARSSRAMTVESVARSYSSDESPRSRGVDSPSCAKTVRPGNRGRRETPGAR